MEPPPLSPRLRAGFFANAGIAQELRQGAVKHTRLGLLVLNFVPSWFSVNMGTGIISILLYTLPHQFTGLKVTILVFCTRFL